MKELKYIIPRKNNLMRVLTRLQLRVERANCLIEYGKPESVGQYLWWFKQAEDDLRKCSSFEFLIDNYEDLMYCKTLSKINLDKQ